MHKAIFICTYKQRNTENVEVTGLQLSNGSEKE